MIVNEKCIMPTRTPQVLNAGDMKFLQRMQYLIDQYEGANKNKEPPAKEARPFAPLILVTDDTG